MWTFLRKCCSPIPQRYAVSVTVLTAISVQFIHRTAFTLALTEITYREKEEQSNSSLCEYNDTETAEEGESKAEFYWSGDVQFFLASIFYIGYILTHLPGGLLSDRYGPKRVLGYGCLLSAVCSALTPLTARTNVYVLALNRAVAGMAQGPMFPAQSVFVARWAPPDERNFINSVMNLGINMGGVIGTLSTGLMLSRFEHWDNAFYILAATTFLWYIFWMIFTHDGVEKHPFIGEKERRHLEDALKDEVDVSFKPSYIPALKSVPLWATIIASSGNDWVFFVLLSLLPQYVAYVLHYDIEANGFINSLPFIISLGFTITSPKVAEFLLKRGIMSKTAQHKLFLVITNEGPCICILIASYLQCSRVAVVVLMSFAMGFTGVIYSSVRVANVDLAPNLAGFTMALMNGMGAITGFLGPELFALVINTHSVGDWRKAFFISTALVSITTVVYLIWGTSVVQDWNFPPISSRDPNADDVAQPPSESKNDQSSIEQKN